MPLSYLANGETGVIRKIGGSAQVKSRLAELGFVADAPVSVISAQGGNLIVNIKDSRLALTKEMASKVMVCEI